AALLRLVLDPVDLADRVEGDVRFSVRAARVEELPPGMREAAGARSPIDAGDGVVARVRIDDERTGGATEDRARRRARAAGAETVRDEVPREERPQVRPLRLL